MHLARLEEVLDAGLVNQHALTSYTQLDDAAVMPLEEAVQLLAILQYDGKIRLLLDLFLKIKCFGVRTLQSRRAVLHRVRERILGVRIMTAFARGKCRAHQLACAVEGICILLANGINCVGHGESCSAWPWLLLEVEALPAPRLQLFQLPLGFTCLDAKTQPEVRWFHKSDRR